MPIDSSEIYSFIDSIIADSGDHQIANFWKEYWFDLGHIKRLQIVIEKIKPLLQANKSILEIGSFGEFPLILMKHFNIQNVFALSYEGGVINYGNGKLLPVGHPETEIPFVITPCNVEASPLPHGNKSLDIITCFEVLEHLRTDPMFMMTEINRTLVDQGMLILTTPNSSSWESLAKVADFQQPIGSSTFVADGSGMWHCKEYSKREMEIIFDMAGFTIDQFETFDCLPADHKGLESRMAPLKEFVDSQSWWEESLRKQNFFIVAHKTSQPKMRKYVPLYSADIASENQQSLQDEISSLQVENQIQKDQLAHLKELESKFKHPGFLLKQALRSLLGSKG